MKISKFGFWLPRWLPAWDPGTILNRKHLYFSFLLTSSPLLNLLSRFHPVADRASEVLDSSSSTRPSRRSRRILRRNPRVLLWIWCQKIGNRLLIGEMRDFAPRNVSMYGQEPLNTCCPHEPAGIEGEERELDDQRGHGQRRR